MKASDGESKVNEDHLIAFLVGETKAQLETILSLLKKAEDATQNETPDTAENLTEDDAMMPVLRQLGGPSMRGATGTGQARAPANLLSINAMRSIYTLMELLWVWGILPCLNVQVASFFNPSAREPKLEIYQDRLGQALPKSLLCSKQFIETLLPMTPEAVEALQVGCWTRLKSYTITAHHPLFSNFVLGRSIGRILYGLVLYTGPPVNGREINVTRIIAVTPGGESGEEGGEPLPKQALRILQSIALTRQGYGQNKAEVVSGLRMASQSLGWVKRRCAQLMRVLLLSDRGLEAVFQGYLDGQLESAHLSKMVQQVVLLVTSLPAAMDKDTYFGYIVQQTVPLLVYGVRNEDKVLVNLLCMLSNRMASVVPHLVTSMLRDLAQPLLEPIFDPFTVNKTEYASGGSKYSSAVSSVGGAVYAEALSDAASAGSNSRATLALCVQVLYSLLTLAPHTPALLHCYHQSGAVTAVVSLSLACLGIRTARASSLTTAALSVCVVVFRSCSPTPALAADSEQEEGQGGVEGVGKREEAVARAALVAALVGLKHGYSYSPDGDGGVHLRRPEDDASSSLVASASMLAASASGGGESSHGPMSAWEPQQLLMALQTRGKPDAGEEDAGSKDGAGEGEELRDLQKLLQLAASQATLNGDEDEDEDDGHSAGIQRLVANRATAIMQANEKGRALCELLVYVEEAHQDQEEGGTTKSSSVFSSVASAVFSQCLTAFLQLPSTSAPSSCVAGWTQRDKATFEERLRSPSTNGLLLLLLRSHVPLSVLFSNGEKILSLVSLYLTSCVERLCVMLDHAQVAQVEVVFASDPLAEQRHDPVSDHSPLSELLSVSASAETAASSCGHGGKDTGGGPLIEVISSSVSDGADAHDASEIEEEDTFGASAVLDGITSAGEERGGMQEEKGGDFDEMFEACSTCLAIVDAVVTLGSSEGKVRTRGEEICIDSILAPLKTLSGLSLSIASSSTSTSTDIGAEAGCGASMVTQEVGERVETLSEVATALAVTILTRHLSSSLFSKVPSDTSAPHGDEVVGAHATPLSNAFEAVVLEGDHRGHLISSDASNRAYGVRLLTDAFQSALATHRKSSDRGVRDLDDSKRAAKVAMQALLVVLRREGNVGRHDAAGANFAQDDDATTSASESFVFLGVYRAVRLIATVNRVSVLKVLCEEFGRDDDAYVSVRSRALVAQALAEVLRHGGSESAVSQATSLRAVLAAAVSVVRNYRLSEKEMTTLDPAVDLSKMSMHKVAEDDDEEPRESRRRREKDRARTEPAPQALAQLADRVLLRQSSLSVLAECVRVGGWACLSHGLAESVLDIAWGVLHLEGGLVVRHEDVIDAQSNRASRRAASFLLRYMVSSLQDKLFTLEVAHGGARGTPSLTQFSNVLNADVMDEAVPVQREPKLTILHRIYRLLKHASAHDRDDVVRHHAAAALAIVDEMVREQFTGLFEKEQAPQIRIL